MPDPSNLVLPAHFQFSQLSLKDFQDCPKRFQLKYLEQRAWPALISEPAYAQEQRALLGAVFHRMIQQHQLGIDPQILQDTIPGYFPGDGSQDLLSWWQNYLDYYPSIIQAEKYSEIPLVTRVAGYRLLARLDYLSLSASPERDRRRALIIDWKTSQKPGRRESLNTGLQTRVYRFTLVNNGSLLNQGYPIRPEQVEMLYWYAGAPDQSVRLPYNQALYQDDEQVLADLVLDIKQRGPDDFPMTGRERNCLFCVYRSLCERGVHAGHLDEEEMSDEQAVLDFDEVEEIAF